MPKASRPSTAAEALVAEGKAGKVLAIKETADRIDGRVPQAIVGSDEDPPLIDLDDDRELANVFSDA